MFTIETSPEYWEKIRAIIREECNKKEKCPVASPALETAGLQYKPIYKMEEVCAIFSVSRQTIYQWVERGLLKPHKIRSRVYFLWEDVQVLVRPLDH